MTELLIYSITSSQPTLHAFIVWMRSVNLRNSFWKSIWLLWVLPPMWTVTPPAPGITLAHSRRWQMKEDSVMPTTIMVDPTHTMFTPGSFVIWRPVNVLGWY